MKLKGFRHLTARSRKKIIRRLARRWQDLSNDLAFWESEKWVAQMDGDRPAASWANIRIAFISRALTKIEDQLSP